MKKRTERSQRMQAENLAGPERATWWSRCWPGRRRRASTGWPGSTRTGRPRWTRSSARRPRPWQGRQGGIKPTGPIITGARRRRDSPSAAAVCRGSARAGGSTSGGAAILPSEAAFRDGDLSRGGGELGLLLRMGEPFHPIYALQEHFRGLLAIELHLVTMAPSGWVLEPQGLLARGPRSAGSRPPAR
jgi:hypothetical protein